MYALSLTGNRQDAEDLLQETFVKAYLSYENTGSIKYWLIVVLKNEFLQQQRKRKREILNNETDIVTSQQDVLIELIEKEERKELFREIQKLPLSMKQILIESVYFQMSDSDIASLHNITNVNDIPEADDLEKRINKCINRRIKRTVIRTVATILIVVLAVVFVVHPVMNAMFFDPSGMNEGEEQKMLCVMRDYVETNFPYREVVSLEIEEKGFGRYEIAMQMVDRSQPPINIGGSNIWVDMNWGKYGMKKDPDSVMTVNVGRFGCDWNDQEDMIKQIEELPKSADIFLSVSDTQQIKFQRN